ncbi:hypothetical protein ACFXMT_27710 [Streptomyces mirabilis]|uniref:hypothetical protein n=1 Tax=Streptomyces mirabilis TaxID=68239 RepID=UPI0036B63C43
MNTVMELTRLVWSGSYHGAGGGYGAEERDGYYDYADAIPLLFTTLDRLQTSGPRTAVWWRCGHGLKQTGARFATTEDAAGCPPVVTTGTRADGRADRGAWDRKGLMRCHRPWFVVEPTRPWDVESGAVR